VTSFCLYTNAAVAMLEIHVTVLQQCNVFLQVATVVRYYAPVEIRRLRITLSDFRIVSHRMFPLIRPKPPTWQRDLTLRSAVSDVS